MKTLKEAYAALPEFRKRLEEILDKELENGMKNIFLVGTGGTYSYALPMTYFAKKTSDFPVYAENGKELMTNCHKQLGEGSLCFYCSATGNTKDILQAMEYTRSKGAKNLALVSVDENPMQPLADYNFVAEGGSAMFMTFMLLILTFGKDLGRTKTWSVFHVLIALDIAIAILMFDSREALSSIASGLTRLVLDGTIGLAIRAKYADKAARGK